MVTDILNFDNYGQELVAFIYHPHRSPDHEVEEKKGLETTASSLFEHLSMLYRPQIFRFLAEPSDQIARSGSMVCAAQPYDQREVERVLNITPGNRKGQSNKWDNGGVLGKLAR